MKKILIIFSLFLIIILIYYIKKDDDISYLEITDIKKVNINSKKLNDYIIYKKDSYRLIDFLYDIKENINFNYNKKNYYINNLFIKSDLIVLNIGHNDLNYINKKENDIYFCIDKLIDDYSNIINMIRKISKEKIVIINSYNIEKKYDDYLYNKFNNLKDKYKIEVFNKKDFLNYYKVFTK